MPRRAQLPKPIQIKALIGPDEICGAVRASCSQLVGDETAIAACCIAINYALHRAITPGRGPDQAASTLNRLKRLTCGDLAALPDRAHLSQMAAADGDAVAQSGEPDLLMARLNEAQQLRRLLDPDWTISADPEQAMRDVSELAAAAAAQIKAGIARTKQDRRAEFRLTAQAAGVEAIHAYHLLTGRPVRMSRIPDGYEGVPGTPTGPLIRFLNKLYDYARTRLVALDGNRDIAGVEALNPKPDTLVGWIRAYKAAEQSRKPNITFS
jgi:hypothetical protein